VVRIFKMLFLKDKKTQVRLFSLEDPVLSTVIKAAGKLFESMDGISHDFVEMGEVYDSDGRYIKGGFRAKADFEISKSLGISNRGKLWDILCHGDIPYYKRGEKNGPEREGEKVDC
jgi:hypothetical protein